MPYDWLEATTQIGRSLSLLLQSYPSVDAYDDNQPTEILGHVLVAELAKSLVF